MSKNKLNSIIIILIIIASFFFLKSYLYTNNLKHDGLYGWPIKTINSEKIFPWYSSNIPLIAIIDSGIELNIPFLNKKNIKQIILEKSTGYNQKHGTMVAGLIVAQGNGYTTPGGLLPKAKILSIQAGTDVGMSSQQLASAIKLAVDNGAKIINISLGTSNSSPDLESAIQYALSKKVVIVAAAGNEHKSINLYPAAFTDVIAVSTLTKDNHLGYNTNYVISNIVAPGDNLLTTNNFINYGRFSGSSAATVLVTSTCALILSQHESWTINEIKSILYSSATIKEIDGKLVHILNVKNSLRAANIALFN